MSPYATFDNNPVYWSDPSGADSEDYGYWPPDHDGIGTEIYRDEDGYSWRWNERDGIWDFDGITNGEVVVNATAHNEYNDRDWMDWFDFEIPALEDPFPDWKWDWWDKNRSGDKVNGSGTEDFGAKRGINSKIYNSYQGDDLSLIGGGGKMKFWLHKSNLGKHFVRGVGKGVDAVDLYNDLRSNITENNNEIIKESIIIIVNYDGYSMSPQKQPDTYIEAQNDSIRVMSEETAISVTIKRIK